MRQTEYGHLFGMQAERIPELKSATRFLCRYLSPSDLTEQPWPARATSQGGRYSLIPFFAAGPLTVNDKGPQIAEEWESAETLWRSKPVLPQTELQFPPTPADHNPSPEIAGRNRRL